MMKWCQGIFKCKIWYQNKLLGSILENLFRHTGEVNNPKQMASDKPIPNTTAMVEPKAKKKYKTKKEKEKDIDVEELMTLSHTMVSDELQNEDAQSLKNLLEEAVKAHPWKNKKKKIRKDEVGLSKAKARERTPSHIVRKKGEDDVNVGSLGKLSRLFKKIMKRKKFLNVSGVV